MPEDLEALQRIREQITKVIARGGLSPHTLNAMRETLESLEKDIATLEAKRAH